MFDDLEQNTQELVIQKLERYSTSYLIEYLPYKKYEFIYNKVAKADAAPNEELIRGISKYYYEVARDLLTQIFHETEDEDSCVAAAYGLAKSKQGIIILETALQSENAIQQVSAASGICENADTDSEPELVEIMKRYQTHENYQVRLECIFGLSRSENLSSEYINAALQDENDSVRRRAMNIAGNIDASIAKAFVTLLEDKKGYIVATVFNTLEKGHVRLDEEAFANAIISELIIRESGRPSNYFNTEIIADAFQLLFKWNSRLYGETLEPYVT